MLRALLRGNWLPLSVHFVHAPPPDLGVHRRLFGPKLVFDDEFNGIVCTSSDLDRRNPAADPGLARYARQFVDTLPHAERQSTTQEVRKAIYMLLPLGYASISGVAEGLALNVRRLQRLLAAEGSEFQSLLTSVRRDVAVRYLSSQRHSLTEVAEMLGHSRLSSFTRWFAREFGLPPSEWQKLRGIHHISSAVPPRTFKQPTPRDLAADPAGARTIAGPLGGMVLSPGRRKPSCCLRPKT